MPSPQAESHQAGQAALVVGLADLVAQAWALLDLHNLKASLPKVAIALTAIIDRYGKASAAGAVDYYKKERAAAGVTKTVTIRPSKPAPQDQVLKSLQGITKPLYGNPTPETQQSVLQAVEAMAENLVLDTSRQTIIDAVKADPQAKAWARVPEPGCCAFCAMLAARGAVYSAESVKFEAHNGCRCHAEPVFNAYEPTAQIREWQGLYKRSTAGKGDKLNEFRRAFEGRANGPRRK